MKNVNTAEKSTQRRSSKTGSAQLAATCSQTKINPFIQIEFDAGEYSTPFNLDYVRYVRLISGGRSSKRIETFPIRNFFRRLLGLKTKKPRRMGDWMAWQVKLVGDQDVSFFTSRRRSLPAAQRQYDHLKSIIEDHYDSEIVRYPYLQFRKS